MSTNLIGRTLLNQFRVDAFIASGGMGSVYRVWDLKRNVPLAMKVLHADLADDPAVFKRFQREANALKKLAHPNIVPFYGLYQTPDFAFLLERFIDGPSLKDILRESHGKPLSVNDVLIYLKALSAALGYAHANGVVHCDVKPGNVMVDRGGNIYLTDFGIARHAESTTTTLSTIGTAAYMSPEQIRGESVSPAADIYALGVMLFEMLTGQRPFKGDEKGTESSGSTANERIRYGHLTIAPPDPRLFNSALPESIAWVLLRTLNKNPQQRYQNMHELNQALCHAANVEPGLIPDRLGAAKVSKEGEVVSGGTKVQRRGNVRWAILAAILGLTVIVGIMLTNKPDIVIPPLGSHMPSQVLNTNPYKTPVPSEEPILFIEITATPIFASTNTAQYAAPVIFTNTPLPYQNSAATASPPGDNAQGPTGKIVYTCEVIRDDIYDQICIVNVDGSGQEQITDREGSATYPSLSPDGNHVIYISNETGDHAIYDLDLTTRRIKQLTPELGDPAGPKISPDDKLIAFSNKRDNVMSLYIMNRDGTDIHAIYSGGGERPAWSADGSQLTFYNGFEENIYVVDRDGSNPHAILSTTGNCASTSWSPMGNSIAICQGKPDRQIFLMDVFGGNLRPITKSGDNAMPTFSPDGLWIGFSCKPDNQSTKEGEICIIRTDGTGLHTLTHNQLFDWQPYWGPIR
jgi:serine/threonine protein kinase